MNIAESPEPTWYCPKSEMPQKSNYKRHLCQESHNSYFSSPQSTLSRYLLWECPLHHHCQKQPDLLWLNTTQASLAGCIFMSLKHFNCTKYLTPLTMMLRRLPKTQILQKERKRRLKTSNNFRGIAISDSRRFQVPKWQALKSPFSPDLDIIIFILSHWRQ